MKLKFILIMLALLTSQRYGSLHAIVWDSSNYDRDDAFDFAETKSWKIRDGDFNSAVKVKSKWVAGSKYAIPSGVFIDDGDSYAIIRTEMHPGLNIQLHRVDDTLPQGRKNVTASNVSVNDRFIKLGIGPSGKVSGNDIENYIFVGPRIIAWHGGRNEVKSLGTSASVFRYDFDKNYKDEVGF